MISNLFCLPKTILLGIVLFSISADADFRITHRFKDGSIADDGRQPTTKLTYGSDGFLYGTTHIGGTFDAGTAFKVSPTGTRTILANFKEVTSSPAYPSRGMIQATDGNFYGTSLTGGANNQGTLFRMTPAGVVTIVRSFGGTNNGNFPQSDLIQAPNGFLYGVTFTGGMYNRGTLFRCSTAGEYAVVRHFGATTADAANPVNGVMLGSNGQLYGVTQKGGSANLGTAFRVALSGASFAILHHFGSVAGSGHTPYANMIQAADGNFYGTTRVGGSANGGVLYKMTPAGVVTVLRTFGAVANDGINSHAELLEDSDGYLYGSTRNGGTAGYGILFRIKTDGTGWEVLRNFKDGSVTDDGAIAVNPMIKGPVGTIAGATGGGGITDSTPQGEAGYGTLFQIRAPYTIMHQFAPANGSGPSAPILGPDGNFYGITVQGGAANRGTLYKMTPTGVLTTVHSFGVTATDGVNPIGELVIGTDGNLYGLTNMGGGTGMSGTVFKYVIGGAVTILYRFGTIANDGRSPTGTLVRGTDGFLYGLTVGGGTTSGGTFFKISNAGVYTSLRSFPTGQPYSNPGPSLVQASDGNFYGFMASGGTAAVGAAYRINATGTTLTLIYHFGVSGANPPKNPGNKLIQASDGLLYALSRTGGVTNDGTAFKMTLAGAVTVLHDFGSLSAPANDGKAPIGGLLQGLDGNFYGVTQNGGTAGQGTVFKMLPSGTVSILHHFVCNPDGCLPNDHLIQTADGALYSSADGGGTNGTGILFRIIP